MIIREPAVSDLRLSLVPPQLQGASASQARTTPGGGVEPQFGPHRETTNEATKELKAAPQNKADLPQPQVAQSPATLKPDPRKELSFEQVVAWLAVQDTATRSACANILADEVTQIHERARQTGWEAGRKAGEAAAASALETEIGSLQRLRNAAEAAFSEEESQLQAMAVEIVAEALTKIAGKALSTEPAIVGMVREVLTRVKEGREIVVRAARADLAVLQKHEEALSAVLSGRKLELVGDSRNELGGCIVETKLGSLDGRLEVQLRELYETLRLAKASALELP